MLPGFCLYGVLDMRGCVGSHFVRHGGSSIFLERVVDKFRFVLHTVTGRQVYGIIDTNILVFYR